MNQSQPQQDWLSRLITDDEEAIRTTLTTKATKQSSTQELTDVGDSTESLEPQGE